MLCSNINAEGGFVVGVFYRGRVLFLSLVTFIIFWVKADVCVVTLRLWNTWGWRGGRECFTKSTDFFLMEFTDQFLQSQQWACVCTCMWCESPNKRVYFHLDGDSDGYQLPCNKSQYFKKPKSLPLSYTLFSAREFPPVSQEQC